MGGVKDHAEGGMRDSAKGRIKGGVKDGAETEMKELVKNEVIYHKGLRERWNNYSVAFQMANIGSEVYRALKFQGDERFASAFERALELFDFTIDSAAKKHQSGALREVCRAREEFCDYFNGNSFHTNPEKMQKYYDDFAFLANKNK